MRSGRSSFLLRQKRPTGRSRSHRVHDLRRDNGRLSEVRLNPTRHWSAACLRMSQRWQRYFVGSTARLLGPTLQMARWQFQVPEADHRAFGYEPHYDKLPWKESYNATKGHKDRFKY